MTVTDHWRAIPVCLPVCLLVAAALCLVSCQRGGTKSPERVPRTELSADERQSGFAFLTRDTQRLQTDAFENPGYLWVETGRALFSEAPEQGGESCASCHGADGDGLVGAATQYPLWHEGRGTLINLEGRINQCRQEHQALEPLAYESENLLSLTAFVTNLSLGLPMSVDPSPLAMDALARGETYFHTRRGQLDLACSQCHTERWGMQLRGDTISQGHGNGFPTYRLAWQTLGSLHRRFRDCDLGVRAEPYPLGSDTYLALELYLATRAETLPVETPAIRR
ncbi:MAG: sulfur oxidation c-type cytochrome SoxA [Pseudomonadota bacterium]